MNIIELLQTDHQAAVERITEAFRRGAAAGSRSGEAAQAAFEAYKGDLTKCRRFMTTPHVELNGDTPLERAERDDQGLKDVLQVIGRAMYG